MNAFMKRAERVEAALEALKQRKGNQPVLIYADGSRCSMGVLEAGDKICKREDVADVLAQEETTSSLLRGMLGPWDFSDLEEPAEQ